MKLRICLVKFFVIVSINSCIGFRSQNIIPSVMGTLVLLSIPDYPEVASVPILPIFGFRRSKGAQQTTTTTTTPKPVSKGYLKTAAELLKWAYKELQAETEEDDDDSFGSVSSKYGQEEADKVQDSSEEVKEDSKVPKLETLEEKMNYLRRSRQGTAARADSEISKPSARQKPVVYDREIEEASLPELQNMLSNLKREESSFISTISNPADTSYSFGTRIVRSIFCGYLNPFKLFC